MCHFFLATGKLFFFKFMIFQAKLPLNQQDMAMELAEMDVEELASSIPSSKNRFHFGLSSRVISTGSLKVRGIAKTQHPIDDYVMPPLFVYIMKTYFNCLTMFNRCCARPPLFVTNFSGKDGKTTPVVLQKVWFLVCFFS